jgi:hypothetical protein
MAADGQFETRDKDGNLLRYNADDDEQTLGELVRQERFGAGSRDQKNIDAEMAAAIARDGRFDVSAAVLSQLFVMRDQSLNILLSWLSPLLTMTWADELLNFVY